MDTIGNRSSLRPLRVISVIFFSLSLSLLPVNSPFSLEPIEWNIESCLSGQEQRCPTEMKKKGR